MPRKKIVKSDERPPYIDSDGILDFTKIFKFIPKQTELLRNVSRNGGTYLQPVAPMCLSTGGIRSGKTCGWLLFGILHYCLTFAGCNMLVLRRTYPELEAGAISDMKTFVPKELYHYDATRHICTFTNGSKIVFAHCEHNLERDLARFLGTAYVFCIADEVGQFSPDAWMAIYARNIVNPECKPDKFGNLPIPCLVGCTNPIGPHYEYYRTLFVEKEPYNKPDNARKDETNGTWWVPEAGEWHLIYDPSLYAYQRSTVMDNTELLRRDPGIIARLNALPKAKRDKMLHGLDGHSDSQYFDCFDPLYHVINLREDPEAILWQSYQPVWLGMDWGAGSGGHASAVYFMTRALVRASTGGDNYSEKTVCFRESVSSSGQTHKEWARIIKNMCKLPDGTIVTPKSFYFSHEKFARQVQGFGHTPADEFSKELRALDLPSVTRGTTDRIGSASLVYNAFKNGELVITDNCKDIILTLPNLMRDKNNLDDVEKTETRGDDAWDGFRLTYYGQKQPKKRPEIDIIKEYAETLDPLAKFFYMQKQLANKTNANTPFVQREQPVWCGKAGITG